MSFFPDLGGRDRALEFAAPNIADFEALREALLELAKDPAARVVPVKNRIAISVEHTVIDEDQATYEHPLTISFLGILNRMSPDIRTLYAKYVETSKHPNVNGAQLIHHYRIECGLDAVVVCKQSIQASPLRDENEPATERSESIVEWLQTDGGDQILRRETGDNLDLTIGDCSVLYDRILELQQL